MKRRRFAVVSFLLVAVLMLGVGYATLTDVLDIQGTAEVNASAAEEELNQDVYFSAVSTAANGEYTAQINSDNNDKATFTVNSLKGKGDKVSITFTVKNDGDAGLDALVTPELTTNTKSDYFKVTSDWNSTAKTIAANSEETITVTVELLQTPTETVSTSIIIELTATAG